MKPCKKCKVPKALDEFYVNEHLVDGHVSVCKSCWNQRQKNTLAKLPRKVIAQRQKNWRKKNPEKAFEILIKSKYGCSLEQYHALVKLQNDVCAICKKRCSKNKRLSIDHDHTSKKVRGLLCNNCNALIGYAKDDPKLLEEAIKYLDRNEQV